MTANRREVVINRLGALARGARKRSLTFAGSAAAAVHRRRPPACYRPGVTIVTVNWNSLPFLRVTLAATRHFSPPDAEILVVDNGSTDGSLEFLATRSDVRTQRLPFNFGHGVALDLAVPHIDTEYIALLDVDAFPVDSTWLSASIEALSDGALVAGAHMHRNFIHPCFFVTRTSLLHELGLTFRPRGRARTRFNKAPLFLDVAEGLCQRLIIYSGGSHVLYRFPITSASGPGMAGTVFGGLVYHNQGATWGPRRAEASADWQAAISEHLAADWFDEYEASRPT